METIPQTRKISKERGQGSPPHPACSPDIRKRSTIYGQRGAMQYWTCSRDGWRLWWTRITLCCIQCTRQLVQGFTYWLERTAGSGAAIQLPVVEEYPHLVAFWSSRKQRNLSFTSVEAYICICFVLKGREDACRCPNSVRDQYPLIFFMLWSWQCATHWLGIKRDT